MYKVLIFVPGLISNFYMTYIVIKSTRYWCIEHPDIVRYDICKVRSNFDRCILQTIVVSTFNTGNGFVIWIVIIRKLNILPPKAHCFK